MFRVHTGISVSPLDQSLPQGQLFHRANQPRMDCSSDVNKTQHSYQSITIDIAKSRFQVVTSIAAGNQPRYQRACGAFSTL